MTHFHSLFSRVVLALALSMGAGSAMAIPASYHVTLDTSSLAGDGYIGLTFGGFVDAGSATAVVSNVNGQVTGVALPEGGVSGDLTTTAIFDAATYGDLAQLVRLGGLFSFDVLFDFAENGEGITFAMSLYDTDFAALLNEGTLAEIQLTPGVGTSFSTSGPFATVTAITAEVPEPGQWLLMATGLLLLGAMVRRRSL